MRTYISVFRIRLMLGMQYRVAAFAGVAVQFFWGFITIMVFEAFYASSGAIQPMTLSQLVTYVWLQQSFLYIIMMWYRDHSLFDLITQGNIAYELCRPLNLYFLWYAKLIAGRLSGVLLRCVPILVVSFFLPEPYRLMLPPDVPTLLLFILSLLLGLTVVVAISMLMYISVFVTLSPIGSSLIFSVAGEFLAGMIIPIPLMPIWAQKIAYLFPFHLTCDMPMRIYSGHIPFNEALTGIGIQIVWVLGLVICGSLLMKTVLKRVTVQGG